MGIFTKKPKQVVTYVERDPRKCGPEVFSIDGDKDCPPEFGEGCDGAPVCLEGYEKSGAVRARDNIRLWVLTAIGVLDGDCKIDPRVPVPVDENGEQYQLVDSEITTRTSDVVNKQPQIARPKWPVWDKGLDPLPQALSENVEGDPRYGAGDFQGHPKIPNPVRCISRSASTGAAALDIGNPPDEPNTVIGTAIDALVDQPIVVTRQLCNTTECPMEVEIDYRGEVAWFPAPGVEQQVRIDYDFTPGRNPQLRHTTPSDGQQGWHSWAPTNDLRKMILAPGECVTAELSFCFCPDDGETGYVSSPENRLKIDQHEIQACGRTCHEVL